jgi:aryl-alcohol dehydrogenase-like predicted oxidoreductase
MATRPSIRGEGSFVVGSGLAQDSSVDRKLWKLMFWEILIYSSHRSDLVRGQLAAIGSSGVEEMEKLQGSGRITSLQPPYSLIRRDVETAQLPWCRKENVGVIVYSPMASGLLTGAMSRERIAALGKSDWRTRNDQFREPKLSENLKLVDRLRVVGTRHGRAPGEAAIAWTLRHPAVTGAIVGARNPKQVDGIIGAMDFRLTAAEIAEVEGQ